MKKIYTLLKPVLLGALAVLLVTCGTKSGDYRNLIPANSIMAFSLNAGSILDKAGFSQAERAAYRTLAEGALGFAGGMLSADDKQLILSLIEDPSNSGISVKHDMYLFVDAGSMNDPSVGFVAKVGNKKKVDQLVAMLQRLSPEVDVRSSKGLDVIVMDESYGTSTILAYDDNALMVYRSTTAYDATLDKIAGYFKGTGAINADKNYSVFFDSKSDFGMFMSYESMMKIIEDEMGAMPYQELLSSLYFYTNSEFKKGMIDTDLGILFKNNEAKKNFEEQYGQKASTGKFAEIIPEDVLIAFTGFIDGGKIYSSLLQVPQYAFLGSVPEVRDILSSFNGDLLFALTHLDVSGRDFSGIFAATVTDNTLLDYAVENLEGMIFPSGDNEYMTMLPGFAVTIGKHDDVVYVANDPEIVEALKGKKIDQLDKNILKRFKGGYGAGYINMNRLAGVVMEEAANQRHNDELGMVVKFLNTMEDIVMYADSPYQGKIVVNMVDKDRNAVETFTSFIKETVLGAIGSSLF